MMYPGSKRKILQKLLPILVNSRENEQAWVEPFVGGANVISAVGGRRLGSDINSYVICLLKKIQDGWIPPTQVSKEEYYKVKDNVDNYPKEYVAFVSICCSFGGKVWGGYASNNANINYAKTSSRVLSIEASKLRNIEFTCSSYDKLAIPEHSFIYCDPPYFQTSVNYSVDFCHETFWNWCREKSADGHTVFVSEYSAPADIKCVMEIRTKTTLNKSDNSSERVEKLFKV